jgi:hypothetical protein
MVNTDCDLFIHLLRTGCSIITKAREIHHLDNYNIKFLLIGILIASWRHFFVVSTGLSLTIGAVSDF